MKRTTKQVDRRLRRSTRGMTGPLQPSGVQGRRHLKSMSRPAGMRNPMESGLPAGMLRRTGMGRSTVSGRAGKKMRRMSTGHSLRLGRSMPSGHSTSMSSSTGLKRPTGLRHSTGGGLLGMGRATGLGRSSGMKGRGAVAGKLAKSRLRSQARTGMSQVRTGMSRARTGASRARTGMHRTQTGMHRSHTGAMKAVAWIVPASIAARRMASRRVTAARGWTAPQLERAAVHFNGTLAPKIGSALKDTASWIEPAKQRRRRRNTLVGTLAACAAGAALAMMVTRRKHEMEHLLEPEESLDSSHYRQEQTLSGSYGSGSTRGAGGLSSE